MSAPEARADSERRERVELDLRSAEARLETAVWGAGMGLWELDFEHDQTCWFGDWCERLELNACAGADHVARWDSHIHPEDVGQASGHFSDHVAGKEDYYDAEYRIRDRKGRWRWLFERGRVVERRPDGTAVRMVGVCMDIDARKAAELDLSRSRKRLEVALESARGGMWISMSHAGSRIRRSSSIACWASSRRSRPRKTTSGRAACIRRTCRECARRSAAR